MPVATLLKARQGLGYFPSPGDVHAKTVAHLVSLLAIANPPALITETAGEKTVYRYRNALRAYLEVSSYDEASEQLVIATVLEAAATMSDPADLINRAIEALGKASIDLPAFSTLDRAGPDLCRRCPVLDPLVVAGHWAAAAQAVERPRPPTFTRPAPDRAHARFGQGAGASPARGRLASDHLARRIQGAAYLTLCRRWGSPSPSRLLAL